MKKVSLFLCAIMLLGMFTALPVSAQLSANQQGFSEGEETLFLNENAGDMLINGGMEYSNEGYFSGWGVSCNYSVDGEKQNFIGSKTAFLEYGDSHKGSASMKLTNSVQKKEDNTTNTSVNLSQTIEVVPGVTYEMSAWVKSLNTSSGYAYFHGMFLNAAGENAPFKRMSLTFQNPTAGTTLPSDTWVKKGLRFTAPEGAVKLMIYFYMIGEGAILYDDIMILAPKSIFPDQVGDAKKPPILTSSSPELGGIYAQDLSYGTFERFLTGQFLQSSTPTDGNPGGHNARVSEAYNHTEGGSRSLHLKNKLNNNQNFQPNLYFPALYLVPGATYQISTWVLAPEAGTACDFSYWISLYLSGNKTDQKKTHYTVRSCGWWREFVFEFVVPSDSQKVKSVFELRLANDTMEYYIDDISIYMVEKPSYMEIKTDELFYYTDFQTGVISANVNTAYLDALNNGKVSYEFLGQDKVTVLDSEEVSVVNGNASYTFPVSLMDEIGKEYFISAKVYNGSDVLLLEEMHSVYRFDRPTYLGKDGIFRKNGKEYNLVYGSNVTNELLDADPRRGGITIVKIIADNSGLSVKQKMDKAHEMGLLVILGLYANGKVNQKEQIINTVSWAKDHPALYGYQVHDEPYQKGTDEKILADAYITVRTLDPHHVVNLVDSVEGGFEYLFRYSDQVDIDSYGGRGTDSGRALYNTLCKAYEASKGRKPFTLMQQAFQYEQYMPTIDEIRNMTYQSFFAGAQGVSYHSLGIDGSDGVTTPYMYLPDWEELCEKWAGYEQETMFDCFVNKKYPLIDSYADNNIMWKTFRGNDKIYLVIYNRQKKANSSATVPLTFADGSSYGYFTATRKAGGEEVSVWGNGSFSLTLGGIRVRETGMTFANYDGLASEIWEIEPRLVSENFDGTVNADAYKTYSTRSVNIVADPEDSDNKVLHADAHTNAVSLIPMNTVSWAPAPLSVAFGENEICKVSYRLYVPHQASLEGETFSITLRYTDSQSGNMVRSFISFTDDDIGRWLNMEFYTSALKATPQTFYQEFDKNIECYVDDIKVEKVSERGFVSTLNASKTGGFSKPNVWVYSAIGEQKTSFTKTDVVKPIIGFVPSVITDKAFAAVSLYKIENGTKTLVDMKGTSLGRVALAGLVQGAVGADVIGITGEELALDLSKYDLSEGNYEIYYLLWNTADMKPILEKLVFNIY